MTIGETLASLRGAYGSEMTADECVALINAAAWIHRDAGWHLSRKTAGARGRRHDGVECCTDVLMFKDGRYWDVLAAAPDLDHPRGPATVVPPSGDPKYITDPARGPVPPIAPPGPAVGLPVTTPAPPPCATGVGLDDLRREITEEFSRLSRALASIHGRLGQLEDAVHETATVTLMEQAASRREALASLIVERVAGEADRILKARVCKLGGRLFAAGDVDVDPGPASA